MPGRHRITEKSSTTSMAAATNMKKYWVIEANGKKSDCLWSSWISCKSDSNKLRKLLRDLATHVTGRSARMAGPPQQFTLPSTATSPDHENKPLVRPGRFLSDLSTVFFFCLARLHFSIKKWSTFELVYRLRGSNRLNLMTTNSTLLNYQKNAISADALWYARGGSAIGFTCLPSLEFKLESTCGTAGHTPRWIELFSDCFWALH